MDPMCRLTQSNVKLAADARLAYEEGRTEQCCELLSRHVNFLIDELMGSAPSEIQKCRVCGCTVNHPCPEGCHWLEYDLCSSCV